MDREAMRRTLRELVEETTGEPCAELEEGQDLRAGLGLDSVDLFSLVVDTQAHYGVKIDGGEVEAVKTVGDLLDLLQAKVGRKGPESSAA